MDLIEKLGGYDFVKSKLKTDLLFGEKYYLEKALLQYRRENNIFERDDCVVNRDNEYSNDINIVSSSNHKALWFFNKSYGGFVKSQFRHATDAEIKAGHRL